MVENSSLTLIVNQMSGLCSVFLLTYTKDSTILLVYYNICALQERGKEAYRTKKLKDSKILKGRLPENYLSYLGNELQH